jgi:hypothetical protein
MSPRQRLLYSSPQLFLSDCKIRPHQVASIVPHFRYDDVGNRGRNVPSPHTPSRIYMLSYSIVLEGARVQAIGSCAPQKLQAHCGTCSDVYQCVHKLVSRRCFIPYLLCFPLLPSYYVVEGRFCPRRISRTNRVPKSLIMQSSLDTSLHQTLIY